MLRPRNSSSRTVHVHKFGGASLADAAAVVAAARLLANQPGHRVAVVSAMAGVTDLLLDAARRAADGDANALRRAAETLRSRHLDALAAACPSARRRREAEHTISESAAELEQLGKGLSVLRELTARTSDYIVARGERLSALLVAAALGQIGIQARFVDATSLVHTDDHFGGASPELELTDRSARRHLRPLLDERTIPVVPGFIGQARSGYVATLGRGGSDLTATLLGRALGAKDITLWKDVPGLLTADPRLVPDARVIPQVTPREAAELAYYGAKVLHPRALIPLGDRSIPIRIRPFADPSAAGTEVSRRQTLREYPVKAVSSMDRLALVTVAGNGMLGVPGIAERTFAALHRERVSVSLISQASSEHSICFTVPEVNASTAREALRQAFATEIAHREIDGIEVRASVAALAVVGLGMSGTPGIAARLFDALATARINVIAIAQGSSELNISVIVDAREASAAVRRVHAAFQLNRIGGGRVTPRDRVDVVLLGFGTIGRTLVPMVRKAVRDGAPLRVVAVTDRSGFVFEPNGMSDRRLGALARHKSRGGALAAAPGGAQASDVSEAVREIARHALVNPVVVDLTAHETTPALRLAVGAGMDLVLANKRPLGGSYADAKGLLDLVAANGRRLLHETTVGAGLPIIDTFRKLVESGDRILSIEGCTSAR
ncbi:MAG: aspartate kinase [Gemmatimonadaceae bacterium]